MKRSREDGQLFLLSIMALSSLLAAAWPPDVFGGYSYAIDSALFLLLASAVSNKVMSLLASSAAIYNFSTFAAEVLLTSNALELNTDAISILGLFYIHYGSAMVAISVALLVARRKHGPGASMGINKRRDTDIRHNLKIEIPQ